MSWIALIGLVLAGAAGTLAAQVGAPDGGPHAAPAQSRVR